MKKITSIFLAGIMMFIFVSETFAARPKPSSAVVYTAPLTLYWLSKAGVPEAVEYVQYIDAETILKAENISQYERVERINKIYQEIRYSSLNDFIAAGNYTNVIDLGCGVSPRCLWTARKGINYVGVDLQDVVNVLNIYAPNFIKDDMKNYVKFVVADVAKRDEMKNTTKGLQGEVCIVGEDLLMYLSREQQKAMLENIREILKEQGGCFVTSDFTSGEIFMSSNKAVYGDEDALVVAKETQRLYEDISEVAFGNTLFKSTEEAVKFVEDLGLKVEMRPVFTSTPDLISIRDLNSRDIEKIHAMTQQKLLWVITVDDKK